MDAGEIVTQAAGSGAITGVALLVGKVIREWREVREASEKKEEKGKAEKQRKDDDVAFGILRDEVRDLRSEVNRHKGDLNAVLLAFKEMRAEILAQLNSLTTAALHRRKEDEESGG